jgi:thiosulfate/3-mercaptopyruvate sulfurtransferase
MTCIDCHTGSELHGDYDAESAEDLPGHRYDTADDPRCDSCHQSTGSDDNIMHNMHGDTLSCQVCHSISYTSCDGCHVAISEQTGNPFFETSNTYLTFLIGRNPLQGEERPYEYTTVRHVPVDPESFAFYGENLLADFNAEPTWRLTTPHNIQRETPQTETCNTCHGNPDLFLTSDKVAPEELEANLSVIVEEIPEAR